ncbi:hypothetical protein [Rubritalea halochordaticola]
MHLPRLLTHASLLLAIPLFTSCGHSGWWPDVDSAGKCSQRQKIQALTPDKEIKWKPDGHINTSHIVALAAYPGDPHKAERYAYFSQVPDAQWFRFSAPSVSVWATLFPWEWDYRCEINNVLHSLHGGDQQMIDIRRQRLIALIQHYVAQDTKENDWKIGFLIHALGDSYAHVYDKPGEPGHFAYGPGIGHIKPRGSFSPDSIADNFDNYLAYLTALYSALDTGQGNPKALADYTRFISKTVEESKSQPDPDAYVSSQVSEYNLSGAPTLQYCEHLKWVKEVNKCKVQHFLKQTRKQLCAPRSR